MGFELIVDRWLHIMAGVMWIGLLYYFNFVQAAGVAAAKADGTAGGITKHIAPRALLFFRWAAVVTWVTGAVYLMRAGHLSFTDAFMLKGASATIGLGAWLGTIMFFNVWVLIWPNQKKVLGIVPADDAAKAKAARVAFLASRTNTMLSIPMIFFMVAGPHGLPV
ncbi:MAG TPA: urate hydroxylase PuuD [Burkholderiales bacterium]|nr:urate hydroxylase PuuD [Burkholderiales bacterium]